MFLKKEIENKQNEQKKINFEKKIQKMFFGGKAWIIIFENNQQIKNEKKMLR